MLPARTHVDETRKFEPSFQGREERLKVRGAWVVKSFDPGGDWRYVDAMLLQTRRGFSCRIS